ncbi:hypothetical protein [Fimbriiglobus ruber]|uniref:Methanolan biosynthesis EpsI domain-containing protein n=1 Tax=Fimbriiglobus ruber TaxID=1908690 RepID=A0A225DQ39_9BACT|nr:hypothetical protein [Fimbriiglobus ruber]OWK43570.1 hypothetical protein FRUB_03169 [Fimbriiglobus ruber]
MNRIALVICFVLLGAGALVHGATTHRWAVLAPAASLADQFHAFEVTVGDFQAESVPNDMPLKERSIGTTCRYFSPSRNATVVVALTSGPPGAVSTHTPDVCYPSSGYRTLRGPTVETIGLPGGEKVSYYVAEFEKKSATRTERHKVRWAWTADGNWAAPDRPRFAYLRVAELYKLYIVTPVPDGDSDGAAEDPPVVRQFVAATFAQYAGLFAGRH